MTEPGTMTQKQQGRITVALIVGVVLAGFFFIPRWTEESRVRRQARELARGLSGQLMQLTKGEHRDTLPERDVWGRRFEVVFNVGEYRQSVTVTSGGRDLVHGSSDDISGKYTRMDLDKVVGDTIERGARRVGKGFTDGALESLKRDDDKGSGGFLGRLRKKKAEK